MKVVFFIILVFILIGFALPFLKRYMDNKQTSTDQTVWWIVGTTAWGIISIILIVWWFLAKFS